MTTYARVAELSVDIETWTFAPLTLAVSGGWERRTTLVRAHGRGSIGVGEDVTYETGDHEAVDASPLRLPTGRSTLDGFSRAVDECDLWPRGPEREPSRDYRRWAIESAGLDLALRQAGRGLGDALGRPARALRFVASLSLGDPASLEGILARRALDPTLRFKLDPAPNWDDALVAALVALDAVDTIDMKGRYEPNPALSPLNVARYGPLAAAFPNAFIEDPLPGDDAERALADAWHRVTWDAPLHAIDDIARLDPLPRVVNMKPSRFGTLGRLFDCHDWLAANDIGAYGGGQFELGPGRGQAQALAAIFHPDGPNDLAPSGWNAAKLERALPRSPLAPALLPVGFGWVDGEDHTRVQ